MFKEQSSKSKVQRAKFKVQSSDIVSPTAKIKEQSSKFRFCIACGENQRAKRKEQSSDFVSPAAMSINEELYFQSHQKGAICAFLIPPLNFDIWTL